MSDMHELSRQLRFARLEMELAKVQRRLTWAERIAGFAAVSVILRPVVEWLWPI